MASPASTPSSAGSPAVLAPCPPTLTMKPTTASAGMATIAPNGNIPAQCLGPRKEWVIPPRPKPGRKPATDTPPTKRKAQNRAAQRAFRERRAARVGELEEQLKETEEERQKRESAMHDELENARCEITRLEADLRRFVDEALAWRQRHNQLESVLAFEKKDKEALVAELAYLRNGARSTGTSAVPLPPRRQRQHIPKPQPIMILDPPNTTVEPLGCGNCTTTGSCACVEQAMTITTSGCGRCSPDSHCECLEETLNADMAHTSETDTKRPLSPFQVSNDPKRPRHSVEQVTPQEIDFTAKFSIKPVNPSPKPSQDHQSVNISSKQPAESCGFCTEGTYCVCAEAAAALERENENRLPPLLNEVTPPPSESDVTTADSSAFKLPSLYPNHRVHHAVSSSESSSTSALVAKPSDSCVNGPGTCQQCQDDPLSGLFCRSLAAIRASEGSTSVPAGCCGGGSAAGGCCKSQPQTELAKPALSCADTYKTLSSHKKFDEATDELGNWLPKLNTIAPRYPGRAALDIEAASVMNVIKYFDVRFGRD